MPTYNTKKRVASAKLDRTKLLLRLPEVIHVTGMGEGALYGMMKRGEFPLPLKVGPKAVAWKMAEVAAWVETLERSTTHAPDPKNENAPTADQAREGGSSTEGSARLEAVPLSHGVPGDVKEGA